MSHDITYMWNLKKVMLYTNLYYILILYSLQPKVEFCGQQTVELTVAQIMSSLLQNSDLH